MMDRQEVFKRINEIFQDIFDDDELVQIHELADGLEVVKRHFGEVSFNEVTADVCVALLYEDDGMQPALLHNGGKEESGVEAGA